MNFSNIRSNKKILAIIIAAAAAILLLIVGLIVYNSGIGPADSSDDEPITVEIPSGSGAMDIINILDENGLVKNKTMAGIHVRIGGYDSLQANTYIFSKDMAASSNIFFSSAFVRCLFSITTSPSIMTLSTSCPIA